MDALIYIHSKLFVHCDLKLKILCLKQNYLKILFFWILEIQKYLKILHKKIQWCVDIVQDIVRQKCTKIKFHLSLIFFH